MKVGNGGESNITFKKAKAALTKRRCNAFPYGLEAIVLHITR